MTVVPAKQESGAAKPRRPERDQRILELDGLRGIAILTVMLFHCFYFAPGTDYHAKDLIHHVYLFCERCLAVGWSGVDLFFVLSGFLIGGILLDVRDSKRYYSTFYARRFFRIIPVYYAVILLYLLIASIGRPLFDAYLPNGAPIEVRQIVDQFLFLQNFGVLRHDVLFLGAWFWPTWSLAVEEQFYLVAPLVVRTVSRRALEVFLAAVILGAPFLRLWLHYAFPANGVGLPLTYTLMPCRADSLAIGIFATTLWREGSSRTWLQNHTRTLYGILLLFFVGFAALTARSSDHDTLAMISIGYTWIAAFYASALLLILTSSSGILARIMRLAWLRELGRVSYCLYLIHLGLFFLFRKFLEVALGHVASWQGLLLNAVMIPICYGIARVSWIYFEHPLVKRGHAFKY
jgi:peptidoglycan/LPS O-acetylase OafA/YrhL